eukprot:293160_1
MMSTITIALITLFGINYSTQVHVKYVDSSGVKDTSKICMFEIKSKQHTLYLNQYTSGHKYELGSTNDNTRVQFDNNISGNCDSGDLIVTKYTHNGHSAGGEICCDIAYAPSVMTWQLINEYNLSGGCDYIECGTDVKVSNCLTLHIEKWADGCQGKNRFALVEWCN